MMRAYPRYSTYLPKMMHAVVFAVVCLRGGGRGGGGRGEGAVGILLPLGKYFLTVDFFFVVWELYKSISGGEGRKIGTDLEYI